MENVIRVGKEDQAALDAYLDYALNTGDDAKPFSEKVASRNQAYLEYKKKQLEFAKTRVFVTWRNAEGRDCKTMGSAGSCRPCHEVLLRPPVQRARVPQSEEQAGALQHQGLQVRLLRVHPGARLVRLQVPVQALLPGTAL